MSECHIDRCVGHNGGAHIIDTAEPVTLSEFLLARITEDEVTARYELGDLLVDRPDDYSALGGADPARVLAECEAKRQIVKDVAGLSGQWYDEIEDKVLAALALPYADHPDYQQEWKP